MNNEFGIGCCAEYVYKKFYNFCPKCGTELEHSRMITTDLEHKYEVFSDVIKEVLKVAMYGLYVNDKPKAELREIITLLIGDGYKDEYLEKAYFKVHGD